MNTTQQIMKQLDASTGCGLLQVVGWIKLTVRLTLVLNLLVRSNFDFFELFYGARSIKHHCKSI